jgi:phage gp29-like protein
MDRLDKLKFNVASYLVKNNDNVLNNLIGKVTKSAEYVNRVIVEQSKYRVMQDIEQWRQGIRNSENIYNYNRTVLHRTYRDTILDAQVKALLEVRTQRILNKEFHVYRDGEINEEATEVFKQVWFHDYLRNAVDSIFWGFSLIQLGDLVDGGIQDSTLVDRDYVKPETGIVVSHPSNMDGDSYLDDPYLDWCVPVGEINNKGILMEVSQYAIRKKNALGAYSEYTEVFGMPITIAKGNIADDQTKNNLMSMMQNMSNRTWGVFNEDDVLEFIETNGSGNDVYKSMISLMDEQIAKLILGSTMQADNGSSRSQGEVHERVGNEIMKGDLVYLERYTNCELIPRLIKLGFTEFSLEDTFRFIEKEPLTEDAKFNRVLELLKTGKKDIPSEYIEEEFGIPTIDSVENVQITDTIKNFYTEPKA